MFNKLDVYNFIVSYNIIKNTISPLNLIFLFYMSIENKIKFSKMDHLMFIDLSGPSRDHPLLNINYLIKRFPKYFLNNRISNTL